MDLATALVCAVVGMVTGSSWTTAGTLGVAFVGMSSVLGFDEAIAAGAVDLRRLLRRQDDPALGDHRPGAATGRGWAHGLARTSAT